MIKMSEYRIVKRFFPDTAQVECRSDGGKIQYWLVNASPSDLDRYVMGEPSECMADMNINFAVSKPRGMYPFLKSV